VPSQVAAPPAANRTVTSLPHSAVTSSPRHAVAAPSPGRHATPAPADLHRSPVTAAPARHRRIRHLR